MKGTFAKAAASACMIYTVTMVVWSLVGVAFAGPEYGLMVTLTLFGACAGLALLKALWFTDALIRRAAYPLRILGFGVCALAVLVLAAWAGAWFPVDQPQMWCGFVIIYLVVLGICCAAYQVHFRRTVGSFDAALRAYHEQHDQR